MTKKTHKDTPQAAGSFSPPTKEDGISQELLNILVCPLTKGPLIYDRVHQELISHAIGLAYPIRNGIPILLEEEARRLKKP